MCNLYSPQVRLERHSHEVSCTVRLLACNRSVDKLFYSFMFLCKGFAYITSHVHLLAYTSVAIGFEYKMLNCIASIRPYNKEMME